MKIITTVGTSIFTNITRKGKNKNISELYDRLEKEVFKNWKNQKNRVDQLRSKTTQSWLKDRSDSAEIESILAIEDELKGDEDDKVLKVEVYLLATDTVLSLLACFLIQDWFKDNPQFSFKVVKKGGEVEDLTEENKDLLVVEDLRIVSDSSSTSGNEINSDTINSGFLNLIDKIQAIIKPDKKRNSDDLILNISGGYKAFIPILTIMGQLYNIPLKYIYEGSKQLVSIDQFPINFDWEIVDSLVPYLENLSLIQRQDEIIRRQLESFKLVSKKSTEKYEITSMGKLLKKFFDKEMPTSKQVMGHFAEYKMYEYFHEYHNTALSSIKKSIMVKDKIQGQKVEKEIDLELKNENNQFLIFEVKSFGQLYDKKGFKENIVESSKKRILLYLEGNEKKKDGKITKYILAFYKFKWQEISQVLRNLTLLEQEVRSLGIGFKACYFNIPTTKDGIDYQNFIRDVLGKNKLREIDLEKDTEDTEFKL